MTENQETVPEGDGGNPTVADQSTVLAQGMDQPAPSQPFSPVAVVEREWRPSPLASLSPTDFKGRLEAAKLGIQRMQELQKALMTRDVDYGRIPGTDQDSLYQSGGQVLNAFMGYRAVYDVRRVYGREDHEPAFMAQVTCTLLDKRTGEEVASGEGEASTHEKKHRYRYAKKVCPSCGTESVHRSLYEPPGWFCNPKSGGCKGQFVDGTPEADTIEGQKGMVENPDPLDLANTCVKMACKRAYLHATVYGHACSGLFSQDGDDGTVPDAKEQAAAQQYEGGPGPARQRGAKARGTATVGGPDKPVTGGQVSLMQATLQRAAKETGLSGDVEYLKQLGTELLAGFRVDKWEDLKMGQMNDVLAAIAEVGKEGEGDG